MAEWAGFTTVGQVEWADYPTKVLKKHTRYCRGEGYRVLQQKIFTIEQDYEQLALAQAGFHVNHFRGWKQGKRDDRYLWPEMLRLSEKLSRLGYW